jgi:hypothetical protein
VHSGGRSSTGEFLIYFCCIFTIIDVVTFIVCFCLQEMYKEEVIKKHGKCLDRENEPIDSQAVYASGGGKNTWVVRCNLLFYFVNARYMTLLLLFSFFEGFDGVVDSREAMSLRGSSSSQSSSFMPRVSQINLKYERMENQFRATQEV